MWSRKLGLYGQALAAAAVVLAVVNLGVTLRLGPGRPVPGQAKPSPRPPVQLQVTVIDDPGCTECWNAEPVVATLRRMNATVGRTDLNRTDAAAQELIAKYQIEKLPGVVISGELERDPAVASALAQLGERVGDAVVFRAPLPPYALAASGEVKGRVQLTLVSDATCATCYEVREHQQILARFGISDPRATTLDVRSPAGRKLRQTYRLREVPTFVLQGEVAEYAQLTRIWSQVGTVETDGAYVFRAGVKDMGPYRDLATGAVIKPTPAPRPSPTVRPSRPSSTPPP